MKSYDGKEFVVEDNDTRIRLATDLTKLAKYKEGDVIPAGKNIGDDKIIPSRTKVFITDTKTDSARNVFVLAIPATGNPEIPSGWTKGTNLLGRFMNEIIALAPSDWLAEPSGNNFTVTDANALLRNGEPDFKSTGAKVAAGTFVVSTAKSKNTSPQGKFVKISKGVFASGEIIVGEELGWTAAANLTPGWSAAFTNAAWSDIKGPNACWQSGRFIGAKALANIVGSGGQMQQITLESLAPYLKLKEAAQNKNLLLGINSGFRTFQKQQELFNLFQAGRGNLAAAAGRSNHQNGIAFDLNTHDFDGDPIYDFLKKNAPKLGFIRTVNKEHWHWEYRPVEAAALAAQGRFALASVKR
jgi:hypothetical protein